MDWWLLTFFLGAILSLFLPEVPALFQLFLLLCLAIGFFSHKRLRGSSGLCFGALWILSQAYLYHSQLPITFIDQMINKQPFIVEGKVLSIQVKPLNISNNIAVAATYQRPDTTKRFNFMVSKVNQQQLKSPIVIRLSWKKSRVDLAQGDILRLKVKLKPAHGLSNIGTFNYLSWLKAHNIVATGYVVNPSKKKSHNQKTIHKNIPVENEDLLGLQTLKGNKLLIAKRSFRQTLLQPRRVPTAG